MSVAQCRKLLYVGAVLGIVAGVVLLLANSHTYLDTTASSDFAINRAAAQQMSKGESVYDRDAARANLKDEGLYFGKIASESFTGTYSSFIGLPSTALLYLPWAHVDYDDALTSFQVLQGACMAVAILITGFAVPRRDRVLAWLVGLAAVAVFFPVLSTLALGQVDGFVMLLLAVAIWASARDRWLAVGIALGLAVLLKISPWIVLAFVVLRVGRKWPRVVIGAASVVLLLLVVSSLVSTQWHDLVTWVRDVAPELARGNRSVENQSVPALLGRFVLGGDEIVSTGTPLGGLRFVGYGFALIGLVGMWWWRRGKEFVPLELGALILLALLCGPIAWAHYLTWAIIPLVLMADPRRFAGSAARTWTLAAVVAASSALMAVPVKYPTPEQVAADWWWRPYSGAGTAALIGYFVVTLALLARDPLDDDGGSDSRSQVPVAAVSR